MGQGEGENGHRSGEVCQAVGLGTERAEGASSVVVGVRIVGSEPEDVNVLNTERLSNCWDLSSLGSEAPAAVSSICFADGATALSNLSMTLTSSLARLACCLRSSMMSFTRSPQNTWYSMARSADGTAVLLAPSRAARKFVTQGN